MRDDIYKNAPVPLRWKGLIRACQRDADWEKKGSQKAEEALLGTLRQVQPAIFLKTRNLLEDRQVLLFDRPMVDLVPLKELTEVGRTFVQNADRVRQSEGLRHPSTIIQRAANDTLHQEMRATERQIDMYLARDHPSARGTLMGRIRSLLRKTDHRAITNSFSRTGKVSAIPQRPQARSFDWSQNLLKAKSE